jgi:hypothetical protein
MSAMQPQDVSANRGRAFLTRRPAQGIMGAAERDESSRDISRLTVQFITRESFEQTARQPCMHNHRRTKWLR